MNVSLDQAYALPEAPYRDLVGESFDRISELIGATNTSGRLGPAFSFAPRLLPGMLASVPEQCGLSPTVRGVRARLPAAMGEGVWDFFQLSDRLYLSLTDASYNSNTGLNLPVDDVVKLRVILEGELTFSFSKSKFRAGPGIYLSVHPGEHENYYDISRGNHLRMAVVHCGREFFNEIIAERGDNNSLYSDFLSGKELIIRPLNSIFTGLISDLFTFPYSGRLGELYRDAKSIELFCHLLQLTRFNAPVRNKTSSVENGPQSVPPAKLSWRTWVIRRQPSAWHTRSGLIRLS